MIVLQVLLLGFFLFVVPAWAGIIFTGVDNTLKKIPLQWISGQILLWAGFQLLCVPMVIMERNTTEVIVFYLLYIAFVLVGATVIFFRRRKKAVLHVVRENSKSTGYRLAWSGFWALLLFQLVQAVVMTYGDGDDAFYIAEATNAVNADTMYLKLPYTGQAIGLNERYGLAPFPIWIAFLTKISGIATVSVAHVILPPALISMTYGIYYLLGSKLFSKKKECIPLFLIFTELLVLFGDYSFYTAENFMLARSRQGKAAIGSIVIPMLILLLLILMEKLQESQKISIGYWVLLTATLMTGCLCTTLGALLTCILIGVAGLCAAVCYRKWVILLPMAASCIPCVIYAGLYLVMA